MRFRYNHGVSKEQAIQDLKNLRPHLLSRFGDEVSDLQERWTGNVLSMSFAARGLKVAGTLTVEEEWLLLDAKLPLAARLFEGKIKSGIQETLDSVFGSTRN